MASLNGAFPDETNPAGWLRLRDDRDNNLIGLGTFLGPSTDGGQEFAAPEGFVTTSIVLDTTSDDWTMRWFIGSTMLREDAFLGGNPEINCIAIGQFGDVSGEISSLSLTEVAAVPEPGSVALLLGAFSIVTVAAVRKRQRLRCAALERVKLSARASEGVESDRKRQLRGRAAEIGIEDRGIGDRDGKNDCGRLIAHCYELGSWRRRFAAFGLH